MSYFYEIPIETCSSTFSSQLLVSLSKGRIKLSSEKAIYSEADHYYNFVEAFRKINFDPQQKYQILVLGLGLGSIPYMLQQKFHVQAIYDLVEIDPVVIHLFDKYVKDEIKVNCNIMNLDARKFLTSSQKKFDIICVDLFIDRTIPSDFEEEAFVADLKNKLFPSGITIFNRLTETPEDFRLNEKFELSFKKYFPSYQTIKVLSNTMYIGKYES